MTTGDREPHIENPCQDSGLTYVGAGGQHVDPLHLFGVVVLLTAFALARGLGLARALLQQLPRAVVQQHDLRGHRARLWLVVVVIRRAADAELAEDLTAHRLDASRLLRVQVDGLAGVEALHQEYTGEPEQQQQREAGKPHCPGRCEDGDNSAQWALTNKLRLQAKRAETCA